MANVRVPFAVVQNLSVFVAQSVFLALVLRTNGTLSLMAMQLAVPESSSAISGASHKIARVNLAKWALNDALALLRP